jgi:hypothetical protein
MTVSDEVLRRHTDPKRLGIWGSSYSGGHVLVVAAIDRRVKCVVSQVPAVSGWQNFRRLVRADFLAPLQAALHADRDKRAAGGAPGMVPVVAEDPVTTSALPTSDSHKFFTATAASRAPSWRNEVTLRTRRECACWHPAGAATLHLCDLFGPGQVVWSTYAARSGAGGRASAAALPSLREGACCRWTIGNCRSPAHLGRNLWCPAIRLCTWSVIRALRPRVFHQVTGRGSIALWT